MKKTLLVAKKEGAIIGNSFSIKLLDKIMNYPPSKGSSMLSDKLNGNPIEIMAKNGVISKFGKKHKCHALIKRVFYQHLFPLSFLKK